MTQGNKRSTHPIFLPPFPASVRERGSSREPARFRLVHSSPPAVNMLPPRVAASCLNKTVWLRAAALSRSREVASCNNMGDRLMSSALNVRKKSIVKTAHRFVQRMRAANAKTSRRISVGRAVGITPIRTAASLVLASGSDFSRRRHLLQSLDPFSVIEVAAPVPQKKKCLHGHLARLLTLLQQHHRKRKEFGIMLKENNFECLGNTPWRNKGYRHPCRPLPDG